MRALFIILTMASILQAAPASNDASKPVAEQPMAARPAMQKFAENVALLLGNLRAFDPKPSPEQRHSVVQSLNELKSLSHDVRPTLDLYTVDPVMPYLSIDLAQQFQKIESAYLAANYPYARHLLRQTTQYCVGCHAASSNKQSALVLFKEPAASLSELERAEYFSATRRHEEAMLAYERFLKDKTLKTAQADLWEKAVQNLLAITIRLRQDASITLEMISALLDEGGYSASQREMLQVWRGSAKAWQKEGLDRKARGAEALDKARQLLSKGQKQSERGRNFGLIEFMRAASLLNEFAMSAPADDLKAQAYSLSAQTSENLRDVFIWMRPEAYYEACIRINPRSVQGKECAAQWGAYQQKYPTEAWEKDRYRQLSELTR